MRRQLLDILTKKPVQTILLFVVLALVGRYLAAPWWEGPLLELRPELPEPSGAFVEAPEDNETVKQELATVDLEGAARTTVSARAPGRQLQLRRQAAISPAGGATDDGEGVRTCRTSVSERDSKTSQWSARAFPSLRDLELRDSIRKLDEQLEEPPTALRRPCIEWVPPAMTSGYRPLCRRRALDGFFDQLREVALDEAHRPARITQLGDSLVAGDAFTGELRRLLQKQFGDGGFGYIHVGKASAHIGTRHLTTDTSPDWTIHDVVWEPHSDHEFGLAGVSFLADGNPSLGVYPHDSGHGRAFDRVGLLYYRRTGASKVHVTVDGDQRTVDLSGPARSNAVRWLEVGPGPHKLRVGGFDRSTYMYAVLLENSGPGVVVDNLGLSSGRAPRLRFVDDAQWRAQIEKRNPDVMSFAYGVNSAGKYKAADSWLEEYRTQYTEILRDARGANGTTDCMVVSVLTRGTLEDGAIEIYDSVRPLVRYQREAARRANCGFWNAFQAMGAEKGARRWYENTPQLLGSDLAHPTRAGYRKLANLFYASIIDEFRRYLDERIRRSTVPTRRDDDASGDSAISLETPGPD